MLYHFLIQNDIYKEIRNDFAFELINAIDYHDWVGKHKAYNGCYSYTVDYRYINNFNYEQYKNYIPVGNTEFVLGFLEHYFDIKNVKPLNIPKALLKDKYLKRKYYYRWQKTKGIYGNDDLIEQDKKIFIKEANKFKGYTDIITHGATIHVGEYITTGYKNIESEWRIFVNFNQITEKSEIVGCCNYAGDCVLFPDKNLVLQMIDDFNYKYPYTLDVAVNKVDGTFIIECHDFFAVGLYGFSDYKILPSMFIRTFKMLKEKYGEEK